MKAVILSAGQGKRLLPLTEEDPKALLQIGRNRLFAWQLEALVSAGVKDLVFVTGYNADRFQAAVEAVKDSFPGVEIRTRYNPFYSVSDNLATCWMVRDEFSEPFCILNGDTIFRGDVAKTVLSAPDAPILVTVDQKTHYDDDDMKVSLQGSRLKAIGKTLTAAQTQAESIGFLRFNAQGGAAFKSMIEDWMAAPEGLRRWYLSAIDKLSSDLEVQTCLIAGMDWCEIDYPLDLKRASAMVTSWDEKSGHSSAAAG